MHTHSSALSARYPQEAFATARCWPLAPLPPAPALGLTPADFRILIVNEDMRSADCLKQTLYGLGYHTTLTAYSAGRALAAAADFSPSIALLDLELPDMTGYQLAVRLRAHVQSHVRRVPLIAIAERSLFGNSELARAGGFIGCLSKPVQARELNELMQKLWH